MRKADYTALAAEIKQAIDMAKRFDASVNADALRDPFTSGRIAGIEALAKRLTFRLAVNRAEFLKACGIEP